MLLFGDYNCRKPGHTVDSFYSTSVLVQNNVCVVVYSRQDTSDPEILRQRWNWKVVVQRIDTALKQSLATPDGPGAGSKTGPEFTAKPLLAEKPKP